MWAGRGRQALLDGVHDAVHAVPDELPAIIHLPVDGVLVVLEHARHHLHFVVGGPVQGLGIPCGEVVRRVIVDVVRRRELRVRSA